MAGVPLPDDFARGVHPRDRDPLSTNVDSRTADLHDVNIAVGMLMFVYQADAGLALALLCERSQRTHVAVNLLAIQFVEDMQALTADERDDLRLSCTDVLYTAHERIAQLPPDP